MNFLAYVGIVASASTTSVGIELTVMSLAAAASARTKVGWGRDDYMTGSLAGAHSIATEMSPDRLVKFKLPPDPRLTPFDLTLHFSLALTALRLRAKLKFLA